MSVAEVGPCRHKSIQQRPKKAFPELMSEIHGNQTITYDRITRSPDQLRPSVAAGTLMVPSDLARGVLTRTCLSLWADLRFHERMDLLIALR